MSSSTTHLTTSMFGRSFINIFAFHFLLLILLFPFGGHAVDRSLDKYQPIEEEKAADYLAQFGYVSPGQLNAASSGGMAGDVADVFTDAVRKFQEFASLPVTGHLDVKTRKKMAEPRCGMQDNVEMISAGKAPAFKWRKMDLTYAIHNLSPDLPPEQARNAIRTAFNTWADVTPLNFLEVRPGEQADINIKFAAGYHDDPWPFDGKGGVLAHATMPQDGKLHFDEAEDWVVMDAAKIATLRYTDLLPVAIHEGGHALGLPHSKNEDAIMAPFYQETVDSQGRYKFPTLKADDIRAIQEIYGSKSGGSRIPQRQSGGLGSIPQRPPPTGGGGGGGGRRGGSASGGSSGSSSGGGDNTGSGDLLGTVWKQGKTALKNLFVDWLKKQNVRRR